MSESGTPAYVVGEHTMQHLRWGLAGALWIASWTLMFVSGFTDAGMQLARWSLFVALAAATMTGWVIAEHVAGRDRLDLARWSRVIARALDEERRTSRLR